MTVPLLPFAILGGLGLLARMGMKPTVAQARYEPQPAALPPPAPMPAPPVQMPAPVPQPAPQAQALPEHPFRALLGPERFEAFKAWERRTLAPEQQQALHGMLRSWAEQGAPVDSAALCIGLRNVLQPAQLRSLMDVVPEAMAILQRCDAQAQAQAQPAAPPPPRPAPAPPVTRPAPMPPPRAAPAPAPMPAPVAVRPPAAPPQPRPAPAMAPPPRPAPAAPPPRPAPAPRPVATAPAARPPIATAPPQPAPQPAPRPVVTTPPPVRTPPVAVAPPAARPTPTPPPARPAPVQAPAVQVPVDLPPDGFNPAAARKQAPRLAKHLTSKGRANYSRKSLKDWQRLAGIAIDGIYGGESVGALRFYLKGTSQKAPNAFFKPTQEKPYAWAELATAMNTATA